MIAAYYTTDLYCRHAPQSDTPIVPPDTYDERHRNGPIQFTGETFGETKRKARQCGWRFDRDGDVTCQICVKHGPGYLRVRP